MSRPKKEIPKRISGTGYDINTKEGKAAIQHLKYCKQNKNTGLYEIDIKGIQDRIEAYITEAEEKGKYSISGYCIALGISREQLARWMTGYMRDTDADDETVECNIELREATRAGYLRIQRYWEESDSKNEQNKFVRLLESTGAITPQKQIQEISGQINLGKWGKWGK